MKWTRVYFWSSESTSLLFRKMNGVEWLVSCRSRWSVYLSLALCIDLSIRSTERRVQQCISKMLRNCNFLKIAQRDNFCKTLSPLLHVHIQNLNISYCAHNNFAQAWSGVRSNSCGTWVSKIMWAVCLFLFDCKFYFGPEFCLPLILLNYFSSNECWSVPFWLDLIFHFFSLVWYCLGSPIFVFLYSLVVIFPTKVSDMWNVVDFITNSLYVATIGLRLRAYYDVRSWNILKYWVLKYWNILRAYYDVRSWNIL